MFKKFFGSAFPPFRNPVPPSEYTHYLFAVADPGFPREGANLLFGHFSRKLHENEENWTGGRVQIFYRPQTNLQEGNVFTPVCDSVDRGGGLCPGGFFLGGGSARGGQQTPSPKTTGYGQEAGILLECILV